MTLALSIDGIDYEEWTAGEVSRDLKEFAGCFSFELRDGVRAQSAVAYASIRQLVKVKAGQSVQVKADGIVVLVGYIERVSISMDGEQASVSVSGKDKAGALIKGAALSDGPAEFNSVKLEDATKRVCEPYGLKVRCEIDSGDTFPRYSLDLAETGLSAIEKGARQRHALVMSDGVGGVVITRTGANRAPADLTLPGNVLSVSATYSIEDRASETIVRGQSEKAGKKRGKKAALDTTAEPLETAERTSGDGSATERERAGVAATGRAKDDEVPFHRPAVHLARSQSDAKSAQDEADWRMRTARAAGEEITYTVHGHTVDGKAWRVNEMAAISDAFTDVERDMLISRVVFRTGDDGNLTELTVTSPEAFDKGETGKRRKNKSKKKKAKGPLDTTAEAL